MEFWKLEKPATERQIKLIEKFTADIAEYTGLTKNQSWDEICRLVGDSQFFCFSDGTPCKLRQISKKKAAMLVSFLSDYRIAVKSGKEERIAEFWENEGKKLLAADKTGFVYEGEF